MKQPELIILETANDIRLCKKKLHLNDYIKFKQCQQCVKLANKLSYRKRYNKELNTKRCAEWRRKNLVRSREIKQNHYKRSLNCKLRMALRNRLYRPLKNQTFSVTVLKNIGCTLEELKKHLESLFLPGMSWNNWGIKGWHIDHIMPLKAFDLTTKKEVLKAIHYTNLQPLWAKDNFSKGSKIT